MLIYYKGVRIKIYLVGGAVRDGLLDIQAKDKDYLVVGATPEEMFKLGYIQVGKDFPVFIDPKTKCEYALARKETKTDKGHKGFEFDFNPHITLEEDLLRRDLTINAIAKDEATDELFDPYNGLKDLEDKTLKHVSKYFEEDPLRVLRVARFASFLPEFSIHKDTSELLTRISSNGELSNLTPERIFMELDKAMKCSNPNRFFEVLKDCGALSIIFPELKDFKSLNNISKITAKRELRYAGLFNQNAININSFVKKFRIPNSIKDFSNHFINFKGHCINAFINGPENILDLFKGINCLKNEEKLEDILKCVKADLDEFPQEEYILACFKQVRSINPTEILKGITGAEAARIIKEAQILKIKEVDIP